MPASVLTAGLALGVWLLYQLTIYLVGLSSGGRVLQWPLSITYFAMYLLLLVGICRKSRLAWRVALALAALLGTSQVIAAVGFLWFAFQEPTFLHDGLWCCFAATYMYTIFYLLYRPSSRSFYMGK